VGISAGLVACRLPHRVLLVTFVIAFYRSLRTILQMSTARLHPSLPAPVIHVGFSIPQSKSHVLAGVQDAYWSDDEAVSAKNEGHAWYIS